MEGRIQSRLVFGTSGNRVHGFRCYKIELIERKSTTDNEGPRSDTKDADPLRSAAQRIAKKTTARDLPQLFRLKPLAEKLRLPSSLADSRCLPRMPTALSPATGKAMLHDLYRFRRFGCHG